MKLKSGPYFEDFHLGQRIPCPGPRTVTAGDTAQYLGFIGDRTPRFAGDSLVHPLLVFHIVFGQTVRQVSLNAIANLGYAECLWHRPVKVGATLRTSVEVIGLRETSNGANGIVWVRTVGSDAAGPVLSFVRWVLVPKRDPQTPWTGTAVVPTLDAEVDPVRLAVGVPSSLADTGGTWKFGDYAVGEVVHHSDRLTVTEAEPRLFTRLFQNSARVHYEPQRALVYGGYPMCVGYAMAFECMENRLGIAAINAGTHTAPVHAGDTLFASTLIRAAVDLPATPCGALRCQLEVYTGSWDDPTRVLDLDFWELVPR